MGDRGRYTERQTMRWHRQWHVKAEVWARRANDGQPSTSNCRSDLEQILPGSPQEQPTLLSPWSWTSGFQNYGKRNFYWLSPQLVLVKVALDCEESWAPKNWCFWTVVLEKTLESPLDCKEVQPVHPKGDQSWVFIGRTDVEAETPILWPPDAKSWLIGKDPDAGRDWGKEEKGTTEDEMTGWHHQLDGHEFE